MAHIKVYYRDMLKDEVEIDSDVTTIGRSYDSDIIIDNAGVSAHHARIIRNGDEFVIEDAAGLAIEHDLNADILIGCIEFNENLCRGKGNLACVISGQDRRGSGQQGQYKHRHARQVAHE